MRRDLREHVPLLFGLPPPRRQGQRLSSALTVLSLAQELAAHNLHSPTSDRPLVVISSEHADLGHSTEGLAAYASCVADASGADGTEPPRRVRKQQVPQVWVSPRQRGLDFFAAEPTSLRRMLQERETKWTQRLLSSDKRSEGAPSGVLLDLLAAEGAFEGEVPSLEEDGRDADLDL